MNVRKELISKPLKLLPQAPDAEKGVLSSLLLSPQIVGKICDEKGLTVERFHIPAHATIFAELEMMGREATPIDFITLTTRLRNKGQLDAVGGAAFITELFTFLPTAANVGAYIEEVVETWALRECHKVSAEVADRSRTERDEPWSLIGGWQERIAKIMEIARRKRSRLPDLRDVAKTLGDELPSVPDELIEGVLHQGSKIIIGGTSKGRKTFGLVDMAVSVASGTPWWGVPTRKGRVCYINFEIQEPFFLRRVDAICRAKGVVLEAGMLMAWTLRGHTEGIERMVEELMAVLLSEAFVLIIFDPIYKALGDRDENRAGDVASLCNELERIAVRTDAAIAFGAHFSKGNQAAKESIDRIGGSGVFARDPDAILVMTQHEIDGCFTVDATLRNFPPLSPFVVKWDYPLFTREDTADPGALKQPPKRGGFASKYSAADILAEMSVIDGVSGKELCRRMMEERGMSRATFFRIFGDMRRAKGTQCKIQGKSVDGELIWFLKSL